jgi:hypothetical protein
MSATRPTGFPGWASGASGWVVEPTALKKALGWQPSEAPPAGYQNWLHALTHQWLTYLDSTRGRAFLGDGSDGSLAIGGGTPTIYKMQRHMQLNDLAIGISGVLDTNGFIPLVAGVLTGLSGIIRSNGADGGSGQGSGVGASGIPGPAGIPAAGPLRGGWGGGTGATGINANTPAWSFAAESVVNSLGGLFGGTGTSGAAGKPSGLGGTGIAPSGIYSDPIALTKGLVFWEAIGLSGMRSPTHAYLRGGPGGGLGGENVTANGGNGGGGAGGSVVLLPVREVNWVGVVEVKGGNGGAGGYNSGGGGGGGAGGAALMAAAVNTQCVVRVDARGGLGATGNISASGLIGGNGATGATSLRIFNL